MSGSAPQASECPNAAEHVDGPSGYLAWHAWAARMARTGHAQRKCPGCGLYKIWLPKPSEAS